MRLFFTLLAITCICFQLLAEGSIKGTVSNGDGPMAYVALALEGSPFAANTNSKGEFVFEGIEAGEYVLLARFMGYKATYKKVLVQNGKISSVALNMEVDILGLDEVTITGNRSSEDRRSSTVVVDVLNKQQLEHINAVTFADGIKFSPGIRTETNCQNCGFSQVRINGLPGTYSQILIDGRATFSALNSIYGLDQIPIEMLDRIEVVKGGGSALYGSSAIAGTINLITAEPKKNSFSLKAQSDLIQGESWDNSIGFYGSLVKPNYKSGLSLFTSYRNRDSYDHNNDGFSELPVLENIGAGFRAFQRTGKYGKLNAEFHIMNEYRRGGNMLNKPAHESDIAEELKSNVVGGGLSYDVFSKNKKNKINIYSSLQYTDMDNYYGAEQDPNGYGNTYDFSTVSGLQLNNEHNGLMNSEAKLMAGMEYKTDHMIDEKPGYDLYVDQDLRTWGSFLQYEATFSKVFKISIGGRYDWFNLNNQGNVSPRVNAMYSLSDQVRIRAGYARGFRIPQVFSEDVHVELVSGEIQAIRLAEDLNAELSDSYTLSLDWDRDLKKGVFEVVLEGFYTQIHNPFILESVQNDADFMVLERRNGSNAIVYGSNLEFKITDQRFYALQSSFTVLQSQYEDAIVWSESDNPELQTKQFLRTPNLYGNLSLDVYPMKNLMLVLTTLYTGPMWVQHYAGYVAEDELVRTEDFLDLGLKVSYDFKFSKKNVLTAHLGVKNILNAYQSDFDEGVLRDASFVYGPQQPRTLTMGLKFKLN